MAKKLIPSTLKSKFLNLLETDSESVYYSFVGDHISSGTTEDDIQALNDSLYETKQQILTNMLFGKMIDETNFQSLVPRYDWQINEVYAIYDDRDIELDDKKYYVAVDEISYIHVYKCLDNNNNSPSTIKPVFGDVEQNGTFLENDTGYYETSDGYQWKYMYSIDRQTFDRFSTAKYMPVVANTTVQSFAVTGAIDNIHIEDPGANYNNSVRSTFTASDVASGNTVQYRLPEGSSSVENFYANTILYITSSTEHVLNGSWRRVVGSKEVFNHVLIEVDDMFPITLPEGTIYELMPEVKIFGDNYETDQCIARALIDNNASNSVSHVEILETGSDYNLAEAKVLEGVPAGPNGIGTDNVIEPTPAIVRPILPPPGGHGSDPKSELKSTTLAIYTKFDTDENQTIPTENSIATFGIIENPMFANVAIECARVSNGIEGFDGDFVVGEKISQITTERMYGYGTVNTSNNIVTIQESDANYNFLEPGEFVYLKDPDVGDRHHFSAVQTVTSNTTFTLVDEVNWTSTNVQVYKTNELSSGIIQSIIGNRIFIDKVKPGLELNQMIVGHTTKTVANVVSYDINSQNELSNYQFHTFVQPLRCVGVFESESTFGIDDLVYQGESVADATFTGYVYTVSETEIRLTRTSGLLDTSLPIRSQQTSAVFAANFNKYKGDLDPNEGNIIYLQNDIAVERNPSQSEEIRIILEL